MDRIDYIHVILKIILGTFMLLIGMRVVNMFAEGLTSSLLDVVLIPPILLYLCKTTGVTDIVGSQNVKKLIIGVCAVALLGILFSDLFVFTPYLSGNTADISLHDEHTWAYNSIRGIAEAVRGDYLQEELVLLHLGKYENLFMYYSLMFLFGGYSPFNICIWNSFHIGLCCILFVLMANKEGLLNDTNRNLIFFLCLLMPLFQCSFIYHRDICGQYAVVLGMFLFISTYRQNIASLLVFPIYAFLFYSFRHPYLLVAILLFFWGMSRREQRGIAQFLSIVLVSVAGLYSVLSVGISSYLGEDLYFDTYSAQYQSFGTNIIQTVIQAFVGYFPWTQLFDDNNWSYHLFICLQCAMNLSVIWHLVSEYRGDFKELFHNPFIILGVSIWGMALIQAGHVAYFTVGIPFLVFGLRNTEISRIYSLFIKITIFFIITSFLYSISGLTGSGFLR